MQLTHYTDFSLRVLIFLALQKPDRLVTISDIAEHFSIPRNHLVKVVQRLGQLSYVKTVRGKGGGLKLGRPPEEITIGAVVRDMEANIDIVDCSKPLCPLEGACRLKSILDAARDAFLAVLDDYTLVDLSRKPNQLRQLLHWNPDERRTDPA